jgi:Flp pilus assembly pilin Flp
MNRNRKPALKHSGNTTVEYAICLTLLGVLAVGSLQLLGGNISQLLGKANSAKTMGQTNQLYALIGASPNGGSGAPATSANNRSAGNAATTGPVQLMIDPSSGQAMLSDTMGGSKNTTSVDGATSLSMLSKQLGMLANVKTASGQPLPSALQDQIRQLMMDGMDLSNAYNSSTGVLGQFRTINATNTTGTNKNTTHYPKMVLDTLANNLNQGLQFQNDYNTLHAMLSTMAQTNPALNASLITPLSQLAGTITSIPYNAYGKNLANNFNINAVKAPDLMAVYKNYPLIESSIPVGTVVQAALMRPTKRENYIQQQLSGIVQTTLVGTPPTGNSAVRIAMDMPTDITASSTISGSNGHGGSVSASIYMTSNGISATSYASNTPTKP